MSAVEGDCVVKREGWQIGAARGATRRRSHGGLALACALLTAACGGRAADRDRLEGDPERLTALDQTLRVMLDDVTAQQERDRRFIRYLVLTRHDGGFSLDTSPSIAIERTLERDRRAANKLANSLSTVANINPLQPIDELILRLDLRAYGWESALDLDGESFPDGWSAVADRAPLSVELEGPTADRLKSSTGTTKPFLFAQDFVQTAVEGELYYAVLGVPDRIDVLQARLATGKLEAGVGPAPSVRSYRAGLVAPGGSSVIRAIERRVVSGDRARGYWQAFDFESDERGGVVFSSPLEFIPDSTQVMFTLPNGLLGYFQANGAGERVVDYPLATVSDDSQFLRNAASCMGCHQPGALGGQDQVRGRYLGGVLDVNLSERDAILETYPERAVMAELLTAANRPYAQALARLGQSPEDPDPVSGLYRARGSALAGDLAAGQLFASPDELLETLRELDPDVLKAETAEDVWLSQQGYERAYRALLCSLQRDAQNRPVDCP
jgi:hypothetical protein